MFFQPAIFIHWHDPERQSPALTFPISASIPPSSPNLHLSAIKLHINAVDNPSSLLYNNNRTYILFHPGTLMPDTPTPPIRRLRGVPLNNLNALKHWVSRQRPANSARPTSSTWLNPISKASPKKSPCCASSSAASSSSPPASPPSPNPSKSYVSSLWPPPVSRTPSGAP